MWTPACACTVGPFSGAVNNVFYHCCQSVNDDFFCKYIQLESITGNLNSRGGNPQIPVIHLSLLLKNLWPRMWCVLPRTG